MANPDFGKGRNLRIKLFDHVSEALLEAAVNAWLVTLTEEKVLYIQFEVEVYGTPSVEHLHVCIFYTEE